MTIVELKTGLFPDAARVAAAVATLRDAHEVKEVDVAGLAADDGAAWAKVARAVLAADLVVTL